ncbi:MAG TPA: hypothetical protein VFA79_14790 [Myxococcales bacterium]|nr:hypothetical protein [Myxococcales bacterium]
MQTPAGQPPPSGEQVSTQASPALVRTHASDALHAVGDDPHPEPIVTSAAASAAPADWRSRCTARI